MARAAFLVLVTGVDSPLEGDEPGYHHVAASFLRGDGWEDQLGRKSYLPPLISFQLATIYVLTGATPQVGRWAMVFVSSLVAPALFLVARRLLSGRENVALLAAAAWVVYPPAVYYSGRVLTENMAALFAVVATGAFLWAARSRRGWPAAVTGAVWALSALNRPVFLFLPAMMLVAQVALSRIGPVDWRWPWRRWAIALAAFALVMAPWTVRNWFEHGVFMPTNSAGGYVLLISNGTLTDQRIQAGMFFYRNPDHQRALARATSEVEFDAISRRLAIAELKANWRLLPRPVFNRARNFWTPRPDPYDPSWTVNDTLMLLFWGPVLVFFVTSSFTRSWRRNWPALALVLYTFLLTVPFWGSPRFRFPVDPLIMTASAAGFVDLLQRAWSYRATR